MLATIFGVAWRDRVLLIVVATLTMTAILLAFGDHDLLTVHLSRARLESTQAERQLYIVGSFGMPQFPAIVVGRTDGLNEISFIAPDGTRHHYRNFPGRMKVLALRSGTFGQHRFVLVFGETQRSADNDRPIAGLR